MVSALGVNPAVRGDVLDGEDKRATPQGHSERQERHDHPAHQRGSHDARP
jgi:hypothetical protein